MNKIQSLIEKLWKGTISPEEITILENALKNVNDEESNQVKNHFRKLYDQDDAPDQNNKNKTILLKRILKSIDDSEMRQPKRLTLSSKYIWWAAAAIVGICTLFLFQINNHSLDTADSKIAQVIQKFKIIQNKQHHSINVDLPDGSAIVLFPKSAISYNQEFNKKDRIINLKGKAIFKVAKNKARPFSVFSQGFATTALGTQFLVTSTKENQIEVKLFEGHVRVRDTHSKGKNIPDIYLKPGQLVTLNKLSAKYEISTFRLNENTLATTAKITPKNQIVTNNGSLNFNNTPLNMVLQKLSEKYKTTIDYDKETVEGLYFTGRVEQTDKLNTVLSIIVNMNELKLKEEQGKLIITK
ncbi:FecR family protein [Flavobacterium sp. MDT1-60]|uniref:FecR family protein n=1 Tax=Flavobacterium sp. MDT1-60 TaxID=1979344 RepID=UPI001786E55C|nr:FecR family protein [Flavobacterium sp. MDT1-60]QOG01150.1 FecR family protein [Flavobacterium sp. MDT1-60]